jgi:gamma-glutamyltranspeptidase/glutathione hydrolase
VGEIFRNPDLAWSYRQIASRGRKGFYEGPVAKRVVEFSYANGGTMALDDLREYEARWVEPISTTYHGWTVYEIPPNGQGIGALAMLNIMERFPMSSYLVNSADALHVMIEAKKLAYADMLKYVADPDFASVPVQEIFSKSHAIARAKLIDLRKRIATLRGVPPFEPGPDTTYLCVVDRRGKHGVVHPEQLRKLRLGFGARWLRLRAA